MKLHREVFGDGAPLIVAHGLFGSADNWRSLAKIWAGAPLWRRVIAVDLRNHGRSPWADTMTYPELAADLAECIADLPEGRAAVLGHSLGGKVAMTLALQQPDLVERLVVADIAPRAYSSTQEDVMAALAALAPETLRSRGEADERLARFVSDRGTRQFLLKNLERVVAPGALADAGATSPADEAAGGGFRLKVNLPALVANAPALRMGLAELLAGQPRSELLDQLPVLVVRGERSSYVRDEDLSEIRALFPCAEVVTIGDAGHWLHVDQPATVAAVVGEFLAT